jgi:hypothetical protein
MLEGMNIAYEDSEKKKPRKHRSMHHYPFDNVLLTDCDVRAGVTHNYERQRQPVWAGGMVFGGLLKETNRNR